MSQWRTLICSVADVRDSTVTLKSAFSNMSISISQVRMQDGTAATAENLRPGTAVKIYLTLNNKVTDAVVEPAVTAPSSHLQIPNFAVDNQSKRAVAPLPDADVKPHEAVMNTEQKPKIEHFEALRSEFNEPVAVYSRRIFPIEILGEGGETPENKNLAFELIKAKCAGVRKCNAADANGCWTALAVGYLELLASETTPLAYLKAYISLLSKPPLDAHSDQVIRCLSSLEQDKVSPQSVGSAWFENNEIRKNSGLWRSFTTLFNRCVETYLRNDTNAQALLQTSGENAVYMYSMMADSKMSIGYSVLAKLLKLKIVVLKPEVPGWKEINEGDDENLLRLYLYRDVTAFHVLYSEDQLEMYGLDLATGVYGNLQGRSREGLVAKKKKLVEMRSELHDDIDRCKSTLQGSAKLAISLQSLVANVLSSFSSHPPPSDLAIDTLHMQKHITDIRTSVELTYYRFAPSLKDEVELTKGAVTCTDLHEVMKDERVRKALNLCDRCQENQSKVTFDCGHGFCEGCVNAYFEVKSKENELLLNADGQPLSSLRCLALYCDVRISAADFKLCLGETVFQAMLLEANKQSQSKLCEKCKKNRDKSSFLSICVACNVELCKYCLCQSFREAESRCICGEVYTQHSSEEMSKITLTCANCNISHPGKNFSSVECPDHILCQDCLLANEKRLKCVICTRNFTAEERKAIDEFTDFLCNECWNECRATRIETLCLCKYCKTCAWHKSVEMKQTATCFSCGTPFPFSTTQFLSQPQYSIDIE